MLHGWNPQGFSMYLVPRNMYMVQYFSIIFFLSVVSKCSYSFSIQWYKDRVRDKEVQWYAHINYGNVSLLPYIVAIVCTFLYLITILLFQRGQNCTSLL